MVDFLNFSWFCKKYIDLHYILQTPTIYTGEQFCHEIKKLKDTCKMKYFLDSSRLARLIDNTPHNTEFNNFIHNYDNKSLYDHFCYALRLTANNTPYNQQIENYYYYYY